jgi:hypothetical protein
VKYLLRDGKHLLVAHAQHVLSIESGCDEFAKKYLQPDYTLARKVAGANVLVATFDLKVR